ncbi:Blue light- and temperature-regulated antirepressor YcgF [Chromobacterium violaceum]|uniref:Blue light- and temperature-regulated antirepressor YcgF n=1 Tax=Chromobacterium violaceum TaxID=536 RepID=A0A3S4IA59_CHRVL|nr:Blue light- and temperature-regulated antirepressor YcgF [Chromobacterium violaceum]
MALQHLIYVSTARRELDNADLEALLESCVRHNLRNDISGVLLYGPGNFIQVLEGEADAVAETYQRILDDPRHHNLIEILLENIERRSFAEWRMASPASTTRPSASSRASWTSMVPTSNPNCWRNALAGDEHAADFPRALPLTAIRSSRPQDGADFVIIDA